VASKSDSDSRLCFHLRNVIKETPAPAIMAISTLAPRSQGKHERYYGIFTNSYLKVYMSLKSSLSLLTLDSLNGATINIIESIDCSNAQGAKANTGLAY